LQDPLSANLPSSYKPLDVRHYTQSFIMGSPSLIFEEKTYDDISGLKSHTLCGWVNTQRELGDNGR
jgi:hypothetical protein